MESTSSNTWNPAQDANGTLDRYLPALGHRVKNAYGMYSFDSFQLAQLIEYVESQTNGRRDELERLERQLIPLLNTIRKELGKRPVVYPKADSGGDRSDETRL